MKKKILAFFVATLLVFVLLTPLGCKKNQPQTNRNLVLLVEFLDTEQSFTSGDKQLLKEAFSGDENSLDNFIRVNSNGKHNLTSEILGVVKLQKSIDYFMPKYAYEEGEYVEINSLGYDNRLYDESGNPSTSGKQSVERFYKEQELVRLATSLAEGLFKSLGKDVEFENLTIVPSKLNRYVYRDDLFHPHQTNYFSGSVEDLKSVYYVGDTTGAIYEAKLGDKSINSYILLPYAYISDGEQLNLTTLCHEYMHVLGAPDLYSYEDGQKLVGEFDVLGGEQTKIPTQSLSYVKYKMGWLEEGVDILPVTSSGEYDLYPVEGDNKVKAYKITLGSYYHTGDVFYLEHRQLKEGSLSSVQTEGVIVYRVNEENGYISKTGEKTNVWRGNAYGDAEIVVFRNIRDFIYGNHATICDEEGYRKFGNAQGVTDVIFNSDNVNSQIEVEYIGKNQDGSIRVRIDLPQEQIAIPSDKIGLRLEVGNRNTIHFDRVGKDVKAHVYYSPKKVSNPTPQKLLKGKKGQLITTRTAFLKTTLPKPDGFEKYVYLFYEDGGEFSEVIEYKIAGIKDINLKVIIIFAVGVGFVLPAGLITIINKISKKKEEK